MTREHVTGGSTVPVHASLDPGRRGVRAAHLPRWCVCVQCTVHTNTRTHARALAFTLPHTQPASAKNMHGGRALSTSGHSSAGALAMRGPSLGRGQLGGADRASGPGTAYLLPVLLPQRLRGGEARDGGRVGAGKGGLRGGGGGGGGGRYLSKGGTESYQRGGQRSAPRAHAQVILVRACTCVEVRTSCTYIQNT
jgi:hypothetical protein